MAGLIALTIFILCVMGIALAMTAALSSVFLKSSRIYKHKSEKYGFRMSDGPFTIEAVEFAMFNLMYEWNRTIGTDRKALVKLLNNLYIQWIPGTVENDIPKRYFVDSWGRKLAGDNDKNLIRIAFLSTDKIGNTAFIHEMCHRFHQADGVIDYTHSDFKVWGGLNPTTKIVENGVQSNVNKSLK